MEELEVLNARLEAASPQEILQWACDCYGGGDGRLVASSSFQTQSVALLHMLSQHCPVIPVLFLDTGFHFPETLAFRDTLSERLGLNVQVVRPQISESELLARYRGGLYRQDPDLCCHIHKVVPMQRALQGRAAWIAGVRRDQTRQRRQLQILEPLPTGILKIHPLLNWTRGDVQAYMREHALPVHPLYHRGYTSVGCKPCTVPVVFGEHERAGRWADNDKQECGLHLMSKEVSS